MMVKFVISHLISLYLQCSGATGDISIFPNISVGNILDPRQRQREALRGITEYRASGHQIGGKCSRVQIGRKSLFKRCSAAPDNSVDFNYCKRIFRRHERDSGVDGEEDLSRSAAPVRLMNFVSKEQLEEARKTRGARLEDGTAQRDRSLYEENKDKKDAKFNERFKHRPPKALDEDETEFLDKLEESRREYERQLVDEEAKQL